ncbi:UrcA family protein [Sphingomonas sp. H39-1-10]|uniref:UrcA family protein n=1 Tax=Sphingomonas pollutisoli TaxID=3030829 RepID=UPI0023B94748|nr:UrcA family protein [Sphingomonas pollutisoli]MDF0486947.1 UrcA family protein [Sphingomonas pollutisoli]
MSGTFRTAAIGRGAVFACALFGAAAVATPALADPIDVITSIRVANLTPPATPAEHAALRQRIARAAESACGSDERSLAEYRYAVRQSPCFRESYSTAMEELNTRWGTATAGGGR